MSFVPNHKLTHEENRSKICAPCGQKIFNGKRKIVRFSLTERNVTMIKKYVNPDFDTNNPVFPVSICHSCRNTLNDYDKKVMNRPCPVMPNYNDIFLRKNTRSNPGTCDCFICVKARSKGHASVKKGRGVTRNFSSNVDICFLHEASTTTPELDESEKSKSNRMVVCKKCFQNVGDSARHFCTISSSSIVSNVSKLIEDNVSEKQQEQVISNILRRKTQSNSSDDSQKSEVSLSSRGSRMTVLINPKKAKSPVHFDTEKLDNFRVNVGLSARKMKLVTNLLQSTGGKKIIPPHYARHVSQKSRTLETAYDNGIFDFEVESGRALKVEPRPVVWAKADELLETVLEKRSVIGNFKIKIMADGGQGFFKICMTVLPENDSNELYDGSSDSDDFDSTVKRRKLYCEGGSVAKKAKLTSVNRLILLCIVPQIKESYMNMKLLFELTDINSIPFKFTSDFKLLLIVNGQQTATSMYPCPYCFVSLKHLRNRSDLFDSELEGNSELPSELLEEQRRDYRLKTYGDLAEDYRIFRDLGNNKKFAQQSHSTIHAPLFHEKDSLTVLEKCVVPELHLLQGFINHVFWDGLVPLVGKERALLWPKKLKLVSKNYHGEVFEGNACRKLLKNADKLNDQEIYQDLGPLSLVPFISACKAMDKVVNSCFSTRKVLSDLDQSIKELRKNFIGTEISETLKIHVLIQHLSECISFLGGDGLGLWSEQAGESIHREFLKFWDRHKINIISDPTYAVRLKKAVVEFSSSHI